MNHAGIFVSFWNGMIQLSYYNELKKILLVIPWLCENKTGTAQDRRFDSPSCYSHYFGPQIRPIIYNSLVNLVFI